MYVELHCHSAFSFLDGASLPDELVGAALALGYEALALTDHNSVSGSMEFAVSAPRRSGIRAIHGAELDLDDGRHLTLLVAGRRGWSNLCRLITRAHAHTREGRPGRRRPAVRVAGGRARPRRGPRLPERLRLPRGRRRADAAAAAGGVRPRPAADRAAAAVSARRSRPQPAAGRARASGSALACVATGDVHAHARSRAPLQDAFVAIRCTRRSTPPSPSARGNFSHVLASPAAMAARFPEHPEAVAETARLADRLRFDSASDLGLPLSGRRGRRTGCAADRAVRRAAARALRRRARPSCAPRRRPGSRRSCGSSRS